MVTHIEHDLHLKEKILINFRKFGFMKNMSTTDATLLLKETKGSYIHKKNKVYDFFRDLFKAFDKLTILFY